MMCSKSAAEALTKGRTAPQRVHISPSNTTVHRVLPVEDESEPPLKTLLEPPSLLARSTCVSILVGMASIWGKYVFVDEWAIPGGQVDLHHWSVPLGLTTFYLLSLPLLRLFSSHCLANRVDAKALLLESMILYNAGQVMINLWMVYRIIDSLVFRGHPFISGPVDLVDTGATYAVWIHYCDKYLEFFDTYFMVLRGKMDQVSHFVGRHVDMNLHRISHKNTLLCHDRFPFSMSTTTHLLPGPGGSA
jgi:hypothetical protein